MYEFRIIIVCQILEVFILYKFYSNYIMLENRNIKSCNFEVENMVIHYIFIFVNFSILYVISLLLGFDLNGAILGFLTLMFFVLKYTGFNGRFFLFLFFKCVLRNGYGVIKGKHIDNFWFELIRYSIKHNYMNVI